MSKSAPESPTTPAPAPTNASDIGQMEVSTTFIYYCAGTTLITALLASRLLDLSLFTPQPYRLGILVGLVGGIIGAYFNHTGTFSLTGQQIQGLEQEITTLLDQMNYALDPDWEVVTPDESSSVTTAVYRRQFWRGLFSGPIIIQRDQAQLTFFGRAQMMRYLRRKLTTPSS